MVNSYDAWCSNRAAARNLKRIKLVNSKNQYINSRINSANGQKEMSNRITNLVLGKPRNGKKNVISEGIEYTENVEIAETFNEYFIRDI